MARHQAETEIDLVDLSRILRDEFTPEEIEAICHMLGMDCRTLGIGRSSDTTLNALFLVGMLHKEQRIDELLVACDRYHANVSQRVGRPIKALWEPKTFLSGEIIAIVDWVLGFPGEPYIIEDSPSYERNWKPHSRSTSCYCWLFQGLHRGALDRSDFEPLWRLLLQVQEILQGQPAIAYLSMRRAWLEPGGMSYTPVIVVAPTLDKYDPVRIEQTNAGNCGLEPEDWIRNLTYLDSTFGIDIVTVSDCLVEVQLKRLPSENEMQDLRQWLHDRYSVREDFSEFLDIEPEHFAQPVVLACDD